MQNGERIVVAGREYRLGPVLSSGAGSYGQVWAAVDPSGRAVALKIINTEAMSQADPSLHGHWRAHLEREISFLDGLAPQQSRHIVTLIAHDQVDGQPVLVLERMQANLGQWLAQSRRNGDLPPDLPSILDWTEQILDGLEVVHHAGFVYRDLKFSNILVGEQGAVLKLADFGSLKREDGDSTRSFIGTPATMAPEQLLPVRRGAQGCEYAVDFRADYYALGLLLFALITAQPTTAAQRRLGQLLALHGQEGAGQHRESLGGLSDGEREQVRRSIEFWTVPVRAARARNEAPPLLIGLLDRLLARDPAARPASSAAIRAILDAVRATQPDALNVPDDLTSPPDTPPNRHPRRAGPSGRSRSRRVMGLLALSGLAAALALAVVIRPGQLAQPEPPDAALTTPESPAAPDRPNPVAVSTVPEFKAPPAAAPAAPPEPPSAPAPSEAEWAAASQSAPTPPAQPPLAEETGTDGATEAMREHRPAAITASSPEASQNTAVETAPAPAAEPAPPAAGEPIAESAPQAEPDSLPPKAGPGTIVHGIPKPKPSPRARFAAPPKTSTAPLVAEKPIPPNPATALKKATSWHRATAAPAKSEPTEPAEKSVRVSSPVAVPASVSPIAPAPAKIAPAVKVAPKSADRPPATARPSLPPEKITVGQRSRQITSPVAHGRATPQALAARPPASRAAHPPSPSPSPTALPPIELVSHADGARIPASSGQPPLELVSRATAASADPAARVKPAIELVGRPTPPPATTVARPVPALSSAAALRSRNTVAAARKESGRPVTGIRRDAENFGNWVGRTSASVGTEIQRGLDSVNQALGGLAGPCLKANGCGAQQVQRRDRWSRSSQGAAPR
ncbi:MAG TPA: protein kinase [Candidatus Competibacter sp.]|nr:hypothetical protein [Candidatus Competibacteraceae bacterium]HRC71050.1 protein kinase [Candidatus Competibacter sp.]